MSELRLVFRLRQERTATLLTTVSMPAFDHIGRVLLRSSRAEDGSDPDRASWYRESRLRLKQELLPRRGGVQEPTDQESRHMSRR